MLATASIGLYGQEQREEMFLPVLMEVQVDHTRTDHFTVILYKDNQVVTELPPGKDGALMLELDVDASYTVVINKPGFRTKSISFDTRMPAEVNKYKAYPCTIELEREERYAHTDPFYLDFPSALVRWDPAKNCFDHSDAYLADIQTKTALTSDQAGTR
jgi:hypothetical protein